jgi:hypothetical protein
MWNSLRESLSRNESSVTDEPQHGQVLPEMACLRLMPVAAVIASSSDGTFVEGIGVQFMIVFGLG